MGYTKKEGDTRLIKGVEYTWGWAEERLRWCWIRSDLYKLRAPEFVEENGGSVELNLIEEGRSEPRTIQYDGWSHICRDGMRLLTWDAKHCRDCGVSRPETP